MCALEGLNIHNHDNSFFQHFEMFKKSLMFKTWILMQPLSSNFLMCQTRKLSFTLGTGHGTPGHLLFFFCLCVSAGLLFFFVVQIYISPHFKNKSRVFLCVRLSTGSFGQQVVDVGCGQPRGAFMALKKNTYKWDERMNSCN